MNVDMNAYFTVLFTGNDIVGTDTINYTFVDNTTFELTGSWEDAVFTFEGFDANDDAISHDLNVTCFFASN